MIENMLTGEKKGLSITMRHQIQSANMEIFQDLRLTKSEQMKRVASVMDRELTPKQREAVLAVVGGRPLSAIAREFGVNASTVYRNFQRGMDKLIRFTRY